MTAYYNEIDPYAAQWLRNLIDAGHIAPGDVDERSIADIHPDDLRGYIQAHFFAGIGGWSIALRLAGWPNDRPVWTGSCPCQPFSAAGAGKAADDERHLWPAWFSLIRECAPAVVFGEQVEAAIGWGWLDAVFADLEGEGYACGASVLPACGVGAPHIRQRLWFVANALRGGTDNTPGSGVCAESEAVGTAGGELPREGSGLRIDRTTRKLANAENGHGRRGERGTETGTRQDGERRWRSAGGGVVSGVANPERWAAERHGHELAEPPSGAQGEVWQQRLRDDVRDGSQPSGLADANGGHASAEREQRSGKQRQQPQDGGAGLLGDAAGGRQREFGHALEPGRSGHADSAGVLNGFWSDAEWIACTDGKARPVGPGSFPLGHGIQRRASKLRAYGNAIVPQVAAEFIAAASGER